MVTACVLKVTELQGTGFVCLTFNTKWQAKRSGWWTEEQVKLGCVLCQVDLVRSPFTVLLVSWSNNRNISNALVAIRIAHSVSLPCSLLRFETAQ
jgi:hypothetical protein